MPLPKGINRPEVREAWIAERCTTIAKYDSLARQGLNTMQVERKLGLTHGSIARMRRSVETLGNGEATGGRAKTRNIDLGLALLSTVLRPGESLTQEDIAAWCDCTPSAIQLIERRALRKLRDRLGRMFDPVELELAYEFLAARIGPEV